MYVTLLEIVNFTGACYFGDDFYVSLTDCNMLTWLTLLTLLTCKIHWESYD